MNMCRLSILLLAASCVACAAAPTQAASSRAKNHTHHHSQRRVAHTAPLTGEWGSARALLTLTPMGGRIEYDCGQGTLDAPIVPDAHGAFHVSGQHMQARGGPAPKEGEEPFMQTVQYHGSVSGDRMQLEVSSGNGSIGSYLLQRGASAQLHHCL